MPDPENASIGLSIELVVNGTRETLEVRPRATLASALREQLRLTGTHIGCDTAVCGSCVVLVDGQPVKACTLLAVQAAGAEIQTVEGLSPEGELSPLQEAFVRNRAVQCGFCTPGMLMTATSLIDRTGGVPEEAAIREAISGNLCRCTGYESIVDAIAEGAARIGASGSGPPGAEDREGRGAS